HPELEQWASQNRGELVWAALTLARAWVTSKRRRRVGSLGSFEQWARVMGGILDVAGVPGFLTNMDDLRESAHSERDQIHAFLVEWHRFYDRKRVKTREIVPHL